VIAIREGSSLHYSLLWTDPDDRQRFIERLNLIRELGTTLDDVQEPQVAEAKIHWWHEELQRMIEGKARHPAVQTCQASLAAASVPALQACLDILSSASTQRYTPALTNDDADALLEKSYRARLALLAHSLSGRTDDLDTHSHPSPAARALGKHEQLYRLPQLIHRGQPVFSEESYRAHDIRPTDLAARVRVMGNVPGSIPGEEPRDAADRLSDRTPGIIPIAVDRPGRESLLRAVVADTLAELQHAVDDVDTRQRYRQTPLLPLWRLLVLREKQVALWHRLKPDLLRERSTLTPLVKLYWAWLHRRH
jgi:phytoene synthase